MGIPSEMVPMLPAVQLSARTDLSTLESSICSAFAPIPRGGHRAGPPSSVMQKPSRPLQQPSNADCFQKIYGGDDWAVFDTTTRQVAKCDEPVKSLTQQSLENVVIKSMTQKSLTQWYEDDGSSATTFREDASSCTGEGSSDCESSCKASYCLINGPQDLPRTSAETSRTEVFFLYDISLEDTPRQATCLK